MAEQYKHWRINRDEQQIAWLVFDKQGASVNTIDMEVMSELDYILDRLATDTESKALILTSAKQKGFIAGADIAQFQGFKDISESTDILFKGQAVFNKLEQLKMPTVAMVKGFCLGGGLEMVLACRFIVVEESSQTRLGFPEVKIGIIPGWGGTVRATRRMGALASLPFIMASQLLIGKKAARMGLADVAVPERQLVHAATYYALNNPSKAKRTLSRNLTETKIMRQLISHMMRRQLRKKVNPLHYPAPYQVLDNWEYVSCLSHRAFEHEAKTCGKLFFSETCHNLVRIFFLQDRMKSIGKQSKWRANHLHVIGAGTMGGDIAAWAALKGIRVTLQDLQPKFIAPAIKRAASLYKDKLKERYLIQNAMDLLIPDPAGAGIVKADIIIEAVIENLEIKQQTFQRLEKEAKKNAILATNTSSIPLDEINKVMEDKERLVGIHFFNPVAKMQLVEVVQGNHTADNVIDKATSFVLQIDHLPLPVRSSPGFLVNRILMPYLLESIVLLKEGVPAPVIDKAMVDFGMPMGPVTLADTVGLDVCYSVASFLGVYFKTPVPDLLKEKIDKKQLGRKTGQGFYQWDKNGKQIKEPVKSDIPLEPIANRLVLRMLDEAFACLKEGVVADADLLDAGMIFGTGFAPFRGGPIHYAKSQGVQALYDAYVKQQQQKGQKTPSHPWEIAS